VLDTATYNPPTEEGEEVGGDILVTERSLVLLRRLDPA
jgi:hypothetical protein